MSRYARRPRPRHCPAGVPAARCGGAGRARSGWLRVRRRSSTMPFQVGAASTALLRARNPAATASDAPWAAVRSAARRTSVARSASKCLASVGVNPTSTGCQTHTTRASRWGANWPRPARSRRRRVRIRRRRRAPARAGPRRPLLVRGVGVGLTGSSRRVAGLTEPRQQRRRVPGGGFAVEELVQVGGLRPGAAEHIDGNTEDGAADREPETDPECVAGADDDIGRERSPRNGRESARP